MTVGENVAAVLELFNPDRSVVETKVAALLSEFRIAHVRDTSAIRLSGGERRRCEIARAVAANPSILLLDEPFAGIDPLSITDITVLVRDLKRRIIGVLITDHNIHAMIDLIDRLCHL